MEFETVIVVRGEAIAHKQLTPWKFIGWTSPTKCSFCFLI